MSVQRTPMTRPGYERLRDELDRLKRFDRHAITKAIAEARAHGPRPAARNTSEHRGRTSGGTGGGKRRASRGAAGPTPSKGGRGRARRGAFGQASGGDPRRGPLESPLSSRRYRAIAFNARGY